MAYVLVKGYLGFFFVFCFVVVVLFFLSLFLGDRISHYNLAWPQACSLPTARMMCRSQAGVGVVLLTLALLYLLPF